MYTGLNDFDKLQKGVFTFRLGTSLQHASKSVPNLPGVYLIYALINGVRFLKYFGKAGMLKDGTIVKQGLFNRINNTHHDISREKYLNTKMKTMGIDTLQFEWFVTYDENNNINPFELEEALYYLTKNNTPEWNLKRGRH
jgi:hypothetical protein